MKRLLLFLSTILFITAGNATNDNCNGGDQNNQGQNDKTQSELAGQDISVPVSKDPNELIGPRGYDDSIRWVSVNDVLNYTILFENDPEFAGANAQTVDVRFDFPDKSLIKGFTLGSYGFANMSWNVDENISAYQNRLDLRDSMRIYVDLVSGLDVTQNQAFWHFTSVDPESGLKPWQVDRGMLPINDSTHIGEGFVSFKLKPNKELFKTGDTIAFYANILFDQNDTIPTNRWRNTIDAGLPSSKVNGRADSKNETLYHITMQASDDEGGSGLKNVHLYLANNFGIYEEYATCPVDTVIDFAAEAGKQYKFFSIAEDNVGNREPLKEEADFIININSAPTDITLSDTVFQDDIMPNGYIGELSSTDTEEGGKFTYAMAEGDGAIHNDMFFVNGSQLLAKSSFKNVDDSVFHIRISTTDEGGLSFSKPFTLHMQCVLVRPKTDTINVCVCHDESFVHHGVSYDKTGVYHYSKSNEYMRDSTFVINLTVLPHLNAPKVSLEGICTLVSSSETGNQWFKADGKPVAGATGQKFTPTEDGIYYVATVIGDCYSDASSLYRVQASDSIRLNLDLANGWNWISSNLRDTIYRKATDFLNPIVGKVESVVGYDSRLSREQGLGLSGNLDTLNPAESYLIRTNESVSNVWTGTAYKPESTPISLKKGWNWMGYIPISDNSLEKALAPLSPANGDVIKNYYDFAIFQQGRWIGTLQSLVPGTGYMYYSDKEVTFNYPITRVFDISGGALQTQASQANQVPWVLESNKYPYNMTIISNVYNDGVIVPSGYYSVAAFVGNECRGLGQYVEDKLFMTVYGDLDTCETVRFMAYDNAMKQSYDIVETTIFGNTMIGSIAVPFRMTIDVETGIANVANSDKYIIYPNPVRTILYVNGNTDRIKSITVISSNGKTVAKTESYSEKGLLVSNLSDGSYIAVIDTDDGIVVKKFIKVK